MAPGAALSALIRALTAQITAPTSAFSGVLSSWRAQANGTSRTEELNITSPEIDQSRSRAQSGLKCCRFSACRLGQHLINPEPPSLFPRARRSNDVAALGAVSCH